MPIILRLDRVMADRKMSLNELSEKVGVANVNLSKLKNGHVSAIRFSTLEAICDVLDCQPGIYWNTGGWRKTRSRKPFLQTGGFTCSSTRNKRFAPPLINADEKTGCRTGSLFPVLCDGFCAFGLSPRALVAYSSPNTRPAASCSNCLLYRSA